MLAVLCVCLHLLVPFLVLLKTLLHALFGWMQAGHQGKPVVLSRYQPHALEYKPSHALTACFPSLCHYYVTVPESPDCRLSS